MATEYGTDDQDNRGLPPQIGHHQARRHQKEPLPLMTHDDVISNIKQSIVDLQGVDPLTPHRSTQDQGAPQVSTDQQSQQTPQGPTPGAPPQQGATDSGNHPTSGTPSTPDAPREPASTAGSDSLLSKDTTQQASSSLQNLMTALHHTQASQNRAEDSAAGPTIADLARELMRPMVKDWLEANLPRVVEKAVEREINRLVQDANRSS